MDFRQASLDDPANFNGSAGAKLSKGNVELMDYSPLHAILSNIVVRDFEADEKKGVCRCIILPKSLQKSAESPKI